VFLSRLYHTINLGHFREERFAALNYDAAAKILFGEWACLNFPKEESEGIELSRRILDKIYREKE
jgi:hypothetical protein